MKRIWKMRRDSEAVSPVIATILMVAITVVLAAVLYVMVMGFGGPTTITPTGSFTAATKINATTMKISFGVITPDTPPSNLKIIVEDPDGNVRTWNWSDENNKYSITGTPDVTDNVNGEIEYVDLAQNNIINSGDYLKITMKSTATSGTYRVTMLYTPTGAVIDDITFNW